jgi:hypothetical protein
MKFYLGTHVVPWLARTDVPLFISRRQLERRKTFPRALGRWALDSGGFSELSMYGEWRLDPREYVRLVRRFRDEIGKMAWAAPQDWMCEPDMLAKTKLTVEEHQRRSVDNFLCLRNLAPELPFIPVLQGWSMHGDHERHIDMYTAAGVDLRTYPLVGVGTVCRRQQEFSGQYIIRTLKAHGLKLHGFGFKVTGLISAAPFLASSDSLAWSFQARRVRREYHSTDDQTNLQNSLDFALEWREEMMARIATARRAA